MFVRIRLECGADALPDMPDGMRRFEEIALAKSNVRNWIRPGVDGANLEVDDFLSFRVTHLSALLLRNSTRRYLLMHGLSLPEWRVLTILVRHGPGTTRELRDVSRMDKGQMSRALLTLERRDLVRRSRDATHELRHHLEISEQGLALYRRIMPTARRVQAALLRHLTIEERKTLDVVIDKLNAAARDETPSPDTRENLTPAPAAPLPPPLRRARKC